MRILSKCFVTTLIVNLLLLPGLAAERTVVGMLVEAGCGSHLGDTSPNNEHVACMIRCASNGDPVGILTEEGIFTINESWVTANLDRLSGLMAEQVVATGETSDDGAGQLRIEVSTLELAK